jgi:hypothetical protein
MEKKCPRCGKIKDICEFYKKNGALFGIAVECKSCRERQYKYYKNWKINNTEKVRKKAKAWRISNPEYYKKRREANPEKYREIYKKWAKNNIDKIRQFSKNWKSNHPEKIKKSYKQWSRNNQEKLRQIRERYPERNKARSAVGRAIRKGQLHPAKNFICFQCHVNQASQYHHWKGYDPVHWLDVVPLCLACHKD